jgi:hypothetical protein
MGVRPDEPITPEMPALCEAHRLKRDQAVEREKRKRAAAAARDEAEERERGRLEMEGQETWDRDMRELRFIRDMERRRR